MQFFNNVFFLVLEMAKVENYLKRMTMLFCINELCEVVGLEVIANVMLPTVLWLSDDKVANVRFNVAKTLAKMELLFDAQEGHMEHLVKVYSRKIDLFILFFKFSILGPIVLKTADRRQRQRCKILRFSSPRKSRKARIFASSRILTHL